MMVTNLQNVHIFFFFFLKPSRFAVFHLVFSKICFKKRARKRRKLTVQQLLWFTTSETEQLDGLL